MFYKKKSYCFCPETDGKFLLFLLLFKNRLKIVGSVQKHLNVLIKIVNVTEKANKLVKILFKNIKNWTVLSKNRQKKIEKFLI